MMVESTAETQQIKQKKLTKNYRFSDLKTLMSEYPDRISLKEALFRDVFNDGYSRIEFNATGVHQVKFLDLVLKVMVENVKLFVI